MLDWLNGLFDSVFAGGAFLIIGVIGAVLLLISLLLDGIFDFFDFGDGPLSLTTIAAFTTLFGFTAFGLVGAGASTPVAAALGALAGVIGGAFAWWLARLMRKAESTTAVTSAELKGLEAVVVLEIPGATSYGEIALSLYGERVSLTASAANRIARGERVTIVDTLTPTAVRVEKLDDEMKRED
ncbi:MAG TPA: hypothetical protein VLZ31_02685 [Microbacteriaceae bacterium]|nr:hypothetical protein [Microbacteriaceae bacterium]